MAAGARNGLGRLRPIEWLKVKVADTFWLPRMETNRKVTLPLEYRINRREGTLAAYKWDWPDPAKGAPPWRIWVGDLGKWIEASSYSLGVRPDGRLEKLVAGAIRAILAGQKDDGYIYPNPLPREWRWANLQENHEFYEVGHDIEAAVAHWRATGSRRLLDAMCRCADLLCANFGRGRGKKRGYDGHPEIELALVKLYRATGRKRYLDLAKFLIDQRGRRPHYFDMERRDARKNGVPLRGWFKARNYDNLQAHKPLREQTEAVGHAVRAMYLYSGAADVAAETGDAGLLAACRRLWRSATRRRMYVIGGVGSTSSGEAFARDYDLPNETAYAETCANIALVFFAHRMLQIEADGQYADVMERALYNGVLSGVSLDGRRFFYANHLTAFPQRRQGSEFAGQTAAARQKWFGCACCPPNIARLIASIGQYVYSTAANALFVHLYIGGSAQVEIAGRKLAITQKTEYPWKEKVRLKVDPDAQARFALALRVPAWCRSATLKVNATPINIRRIIRKGYAYLNRVWSRGDAVELTLPMPVERVEAHPAVRMDCGKVALQRGPIVYCLEEIDNGPRLADIALPRRARLAVRFDRKLGGAAVITGRAFRRDMKGWGDELYRPQPASKRVAVNFKAVPYCLWDNRGAGEMLVWIREAD
ncbi:MAG: glycoside hydrolase family 127 protein [Phycisphaerae bacterium]